jgi:hypothetical protein
LCLLTLEEWIFSFHFVLGLTLIHNKSNKEGAICTWFCNDCKKSWKKTCSWGYPGYWSLALKLQNAGPEMVSPWGWGGVRFRGKKPRHSFNVKFKVCGYVK